MQGGFGPLQLIQGDTMQDLGDLFNQALNYAGSVGDVSDPEGNNKSAQLCRLHVDSARRSIFSAAHWPELAQHERLTLLKTREDNSAWANGDPAPGFLMTYALPSTCVLPRYVYDYSRFELGFVDEDRVLYSNTPNAILTFTQDRVNPKMWGPQLFDTIAYELAARINMAKSGKMTFTRELRGQVKDTLDLMATIAANSEDTYTESMPLSYAAAGFELPQLNRYFYPTQTYRIGV